MELLSNNDADDSVNRECIWSKHNSRLRIETNLILRSNTPSPPGISRNSPIRNIVKKPHIYSPRPESVLRLIKTPNRIIKNKIKLEHFEKQIGLTIQKLIQKIEIENAIHLSSNNLYVSR